MAQAKSCVVDCFVPRNVLLRQAALKTTIKVTHMPDMRPEDLTPEQLSQAYKELDETHRALKAKHGEAGCAETEKTPPAVSMKPGASKGAVASPQKLALIGALLLVLGFFVPWYHINLKAEVDRAVPGFPSHFLSDAPTITISAAHIQYGLGWLVLVLGLAAAALPYFTGNPQEQTRPRAVLACLGAGAAILFYLMAEDLRHVSSGIILAAVGYGFQLAGALQSGSGRTAD
jgi:hypothetical protein